MAVIVKRNLKSEIQYVVKSKIFIASSLAKQRNWIETLVANTYENGRRLLLTIYSMTH